MKTPPHGVVIAGTQRIPIERILDRGRRGAAVLAAAGVRKGDAVALLIGNDPGFFEAWVATSVLGAVAVPVNWHLREDEVAHLIDDCRAAAVIGETEHMVRLAAAVAGRPRYELGRTWDAALAQARPAEGEITPGAATLIYSSGTTGRPKGIRRLPRSAAQAELYGATIRRVYGVVPGGSTVIVAPLYHSAPFVHATSSLLAGGTLVMMRRFDPAALLQLIERYRVTNLLMVPTMFVRLLALPDEVRHRHDLSSLRHVVHGAAPCPPEVKRRMIEWWGPIIHEYYGCTESGIVTACDSAEALERPGTVGRPVEGATVVVLGEDGHPVAPGIDGEVFVRHRGAADFTYQNLPAERAAVERDGLVTCGDIGHLDQDGYLFLVDRKRDLVISGGVNVFPAEVELVLLEMEGVEDAAVVGLPDEEYGEVLAAAVKPKDGATPSREAIVAHLRARLGRLKVPRLIEIRRDLPRDPSGKLMRRRLREEWLRRGWPNLDRP